MELSVKRRKKIFLLFFLGIGLPSLILGYLAFRGIQNDRALLEKRRLDEHHRIAELITRSIDENIFEVEQAYLNSIINQQGISQGAFLNSLESLKYQHPLVEEVFLFQNLEKIRFPISKLLFLPDGSTQRLLPSPRTPSLNRKIQTGQQLEFQQKKYREALSIYQQAVKQVADPQVKGELWNTIARVQKKAKLYQNAIKSYETIAQDFSQMRIADGIPLGLSARLELGSLFLTIDDSLSSIKIFIELYRSLINREWTLEKAQYEFFAQNIKNSIENILSHESLPDQVLSYKNTFQELLSEESNQKEITEKLLMFQESAPKDLQAKIPLNLDDFSDSRKRFVLGIGRNSYLVSFLSQHIENRNRTNEVWGLLLDTDYLKDNLLRQALQRHVSSEETEWIVRGRDSQAILASGSTTSGSVTVRTNFTGNFPDWSLEFYQQDPRLFETFLTSRRGVYFYMFLLIAGILIFGLILTVRIVTHELELAKMKSDFVSTISHEFKSPLTSIRQLAEMLQTGRVPSEERRQKYYDTLLEQSERLSLLTDNVLNFAKMEEGRKEFEFEKADIGALLKEVVSAVQDRVSHEDFEIKLKIENSLPSIMADSAAISQSITNLIDNAIKFSGKAKKIVVKSFTEDLYLVISVQDFGIGIKKEELGKVFDRFYRGGDELTRTVKGSGLGLTLVKQIVEAHHGKVHVESEPGQGSTFSMKLPFRIIGDG
ncbi:MAG: hypothetical protein KAW19_11060 [Candidatus Aminicenantes bacterium]|nr:hypothetical protein [Candidatus Aminicenantes bacterium]